MNEMDNRVCVIDFGPSWCATKSTQSGLLITINDLVSIAKGIGFNPENLHSILNGLTFVLQRSVAPYMFVDYDDIHIGF